MTRFNMRAETEDTIEVQIMALKGSCSFRRSAKDQRVPIIDLKSAKTSFQITE